MSNLDHGSVPAIPKVLSTVYRESDILTKSVNAAGHGVSVEFAFPEYLRTNQPITHVSAVQIGAALIEGVYCALEQVFLSKGLARITDSEWFYERANDWLVRKQTVTFREQVTPGATASLQFRIERAIERDDFLWITASFNGFCKGTTTWILSKDGTMVG